MISQDRRTCLENIYDICNYLYILCYYYYFNKKDKIWRVEKTILCKGNTVHLWDGYLVFTYIWLVPMYLCGLPALLPLLQYGWCEIDMIQPWFLQKPQPRGESPARRSGYKGCTCWELVILDFMSSTI